MAYAPARSCNGELARGMTDGSYKEVIKDRGGQPEAATYEHRKQLSVADYGIVELDVKTCPDGVSGVRTIDTVSTPQPGILVSDQKI
jgi:hypothetical protein